MNRFFCLLACWWKKYLLVGALLLAPGLVGAWPPPIQITNSRTVYGVAQQADWLPGVVPPARIGGLAARFRPFDASALEVNSRVDNQNWFRFRVTNQTSEQLYALLDVYGYNVAAFYEWTGAGVRPLARGGLDVPGRELYVRNNKLLVRLPVRRGETRTFLLRTQGLWIKALPLRIYPEYALVNESQGLDLWEGLLLGCLISALAFQVFTFLMSREVDYLWLSLYMLFNALQTSIGRGFLSAYIDLPDGLVVSRIMCPIIVLCGIYSLEFQHQFMRRVSADNPWIGRGYRMLQVGYVGFGLVGLLAPPEWFDWQTRYTGLLVVPFCFWVMIRSCRRKYKPAYYYLFSQLLPVPYVAVMALQQQGLLPGNPMFLLLQQSALQSFAFSFTVGYKVKLFREEAAAMIRQQTETLEVAVSERTQALLAEKNRADKQAHALQLALRELNHRVKNNLAIVSSLLKLQSKSIDSPLALAAFQESRQRIDAMALIHRQLYQSPEMTAIDMPVYIGNLAQVLSEAYGFAATDLELSLRLDPLLLPVEKAVPIALIINEILTNAFKYGLPQSAAPRLAISLQAAGPIVIDIQDNGPGIDLATWRQHHRSFGRRLVEGLCLQLNGSFDLRKENGTGFRLLVPAEERV